MWNDHAVMEYSPTGSPLRRIEIPAKCPTCPTWGGEGHDILFVVSGQPFSEVGPEDEGGHVFAYRAGVEGMVNHEFGM